MQKKDMIYRQAAIELVMQYCPDDDGTCSKADKDIRNLLDELEDLLFAQLKKNKCNHKHCPLQYNYVSDDCDISECPWRTVGKQGRWIDMDDHVMCSCCGATHYGVDKNFCPNCGADMRGTEND